MQRLSYRRFRLGTGMRRAFGITAEQWSTFWALGDVNLDGVIDKKDAELVGEHFGAAPGTAKWIPNFDVNGDGIIDLLDVNIVVANSGLDIWSYFGVEKPISLDVVIPIATFFVGLVVSRFV